MFSPRAARAKIRKGIRMAENQYSLAKSGTPTKAMASSVMTPIRSWRIGKSCWSAA